MRIAPLIDSDDKDAFHLGFMLLGLRTFSKYNCGGKTSRYRIGYMYIEYLNTLCRNKRSVRLLDALRLIGIAKAMNVTLHGLNAQ